MAEWKTEPLDDCLETLLDYRGKSPPKSNAGIPVLSAKVVKTTGLLRPIQQMISRNYYPTWMVRGLPRPGDVVMTTEAPMGEVIQLDNETAQFALGQRIVCMRGKAEKLDNTFLRYLLTSPMQQGILASYATGTTVLGISQKALRSVPITFPVFADQQRIGMLLGALDDKIELNRRMNETLEAIAREIFKDWFVDFGPTRAKIEGRDPYLAPEVWSLFPDRLDDEEKPIGWTSASLGACCSTIFSGGTPSTTEKTYWGGGIAWLSSGETRNLVVTETDRTITAAGVENSSTRRASALSTVIASAGQGNTRGQASLIAEQMYINQSVIAMSANPAVTTDFLLFLDVSRRYDELRQMSDSNSSRGSLTTKIVSSLKTVIPPRSIVRSGNEVIRPIFEQIISNQRESRILAATRDLLLPKLMSGEVRVKEAETIVGKGA
ncbi:restriction endonuclease subunit S [Mesorhizobium sp. AaZ16]|uniref:restriction endonuclease subunit S n=1 Tax=Mesorhizobium sp. AaZ16 TaxID=3402289 RepID=UPI00374E43F9